MKRLNLNTIIIIALVLFLGYILFFGNSDSILLSPEWYTDEQFKLLELQRMVLDAPQLGGDKLLYEFPTVEPFKQSEEYLNWNPSEGIYHDYYNDVVSTYKNYWMLKMDKILVQSSTPESDFSGYTYEEWYELNDYYLIEVPPQSQTDSGVNSLIDFFTSKGLYSAPLFLTGDDNEQYFAVMKEILVMFPESTSISNAKNIISSNGLTIDEEDAIGIDRAFLVSSNTLNGFEILDLANGFVEDNNAIIGQPNYFYHVETLGEKPNDEYFDNQWALDNWNNVDLDTTDAWDYTNGDGEVTVVVLDDGIDSSHPDLVVGGGYDFTGNDGGGEPITDYDAHGTAIGGLIGATADNEIGVAGNVPEINLMSGKIGISTSASSSWISEVLWVSRGVLWGITNNADVISTSFSFGEGGCPPFDPFNSCDKRPGWSGLAWNIWHAKENHDIVSFGAAGNDCEFGAEFPASILNMNAISAIERDGDRADWGGGYCSNIGNEIRFAAPGKYIYTTDVSGTERGYDVKWGPSYTMGDGNYMWGFGGTSSASPFAASVAALIKSANPDLNAHQIERTMEATTTELGDDYWDTTFGYGLVNSHDGARAALQDIIIDKFSIDSSFGNPISFVGDVNGDGNPDIVVGYPFEGDGVVRVLSGEDNSVIHEIMSPSPTWFGFSVSGGEDINEDGINDFVVGSPLESIKAGPSVGSIRVYSGSTGNEIFVRYGPDSPSFTAFGYVVEMAGDTNLDGISEILVGAPMAPFGGDNSGAVFLYDGYSREIINSWNGFTNYHSGLSVSGAGDYNGDGFEDIIIGSPGANVFGPYSGIAYVYSGEDYSIISPRFQGWAYSYLGFSVDGVGDATGDGKSDVAFGAPGWHGGRGVFYVYGGVGSDINVGGGASGDAARDFLGFSIKGVGDLNKDGKGDVASGMVGSDKNGEDSGAIKILFSNQRRVSASIGPYVTHTEYGDVMGERFGWYISGNERLYNTKPEHYLDEHDDLIVASFVDDSISPEPNVIKKLSGLATWVAGDEFRYP